MSDSNNETSDTPKPPKERTSHIQIKEVTRTSLDEMRVRLRRRGIQPSMPPPIATLLEQEWTVDVLIRAGMLALADLVEGQPEPGPAHTVKKGKR